MPSYKGDPRWITIRYKGACSKCRKTIQKGARAFHFPNSCGRTLCETCGEPAAERFAAERADEDMLSNRTW